MRTQTRPVPFTRRMIRTDLPAVLRIEAASYPEPWSEAVLLCWARERNHIGMVAETERGVAGFVLYEMRPTTLWVVSLAVHPDYRRQGVGAAIVRKLVEKCATMRREAVRCVVRDENEAAQFFFRACRFKATKFLPDYPGGPAIRFEGRP